MVRPIGAAIGTFLVTCLASGCFLASTFDGEQECGKNFEVRCEGNVAVNCMRRCGQYCDEAPDRRLCSSECEVVDYDGPNDPEGLGTEVPFTDTKASCVGQGAEGDAGRDAGRDADAGDVGSNDGTRSVDETDCGPDETFVHNACVQCGDGRCGKQQPRCVPNCSELADCSTDDRQIPLTCRNDTCREACR